MIEIILLIAVFTLGCLFPAFFIDAIRAEDETVADKKRTNACISFALLVTIVLYSIFSA